MHIRGFRHTHSSAPAQCTFAVIPTLPVSSSSSSSTAAVATVSVLTRPFRFALFPVGIRAAALTAAQAMVMAADADGTAAAAAAPVSAAAAIDGATARMVWKETWNMYDILYDEVPLLPWSESSGADGAAVAAVVEEQLRLLAASTGRVTLPSLASLSAQTDGFVLASTRAGNKQVVVCPHYYAAAALPESTFTKISADAHASAAAAVAASGPVVVFDLCDLSPALAGGKAAAHVAWYTAFAAMQPDSVLLRCRAVVVRLPFAAVPSYAQALDSSAQADGPTLADAFVEFADFVGEHVTAVRHAMLRELANTSPELTAAATHTPAPPLLVVGNGADALATAVRALTVTAARVGDAAAAAAEVVVFYGDHLDAVPGGERAERQGAVYQAMSEACGAAVAVEAVSVPLRALIDGGEEEWDAYTLRERTRLNFCPCCGDCSNDGAGGGEDSHGHGHGHGHDHSHHHA